MFTINIIRHNILTIISNHNYDDNLNTFLAFNY